VKNRNYERKPGKDLGFDRFRTGRIRTCFFSVLFHTIFFHGELEVTHMCTLYRLVVKTPVAPFFPSVQRKTSNGESCRKSCTKPTFCFASQHVMFLLLLFCWMFRLISNRTTAVLTLWAQPGSQESSLSL